LAVISNRTRKGYGCPYCSGRLPIPGKTDLASTNPELAKSWDSSMNGDLTPSDVSAGSGKNVWWKCEKGHSYQTTVASRKAGVGCGTCYRERKGMEGGARTVANGPSELLSEFATDLNSPLSASEVKIHSSGPVWWRCQKGHTFQARPTSRLKKGRVTTCGVCSNRIPLPGFNTVADHNELSKSFDLKKNFPVKPEQVTMGNQRSWWWLCEKEHSFQATGSSRWHNGSGCPICLKQKLLPGFNDLQTTHPELASQFDSEKNNLLPTQVFAGSGKKFWWTCPLGHSYLAKGDTRVRMQSGCPYCAKKKIMQGFNDMATTHPKLAEEFDRSGNNGISPEQIAAGTHMVLDWLCKNGHRYRVSGEKRVGQNAGCPYCSNARVLEGFNDMATIEPSLIEHFNFQLNYPKTPFNISPRTNQKLWWTCDIGHNYEAKPGNRLQKGGFGCPVCSSHQVLPGFNDLSTTNPEIAASWHPTKNQGILPSEFTAFSNKRVWFVCEQGHERQSSISNQSRKRSCRACSTKGGFDVNKEGFLYFIKNEKHLAGKIGISNFRFKRLNEYTQDWELTFLWRSSSGQLILNLETNLKRWIRRDLGLPRFMEQSAMGAAGGSSETFSLEGISQAMFERQVLDTYLQIQEEGQTLEPESF
jgi:hypothetical protein